jgi:hypothetical protein
MAVVSVKEMHQKRRSSIKGGKVAHTRAFLVTTDAITDGTAVALVAPGVPAYGDPHPLDTGCTVNSVEAEPMNDSSNHFEVTVEYAAGDGSFAVVDNPLNRPPEVSWNANESTCAYFLDHSDPPKPVVNSAGEPFDQFLERETGELGITITMNEASFDAAAADEFSHTVNAGPVLIDKTTFAEGTLKLSPITATKVTELVETNGVAEKFTYYRKTYNLKARKDGWKEKPYDVGLNEQVGDPKAGFKLRPIVDATNAPVKKPWPLDGKGKKQNGDPNNTPVTLEFQPYKSVGWTFPWTSAAAWAA